MNSGRIAPLTPNAWLRFAVLEQLLPDEASEVLEIGCGQGAAGVRLAERYDYLGLEPDLASWSVARDRLAALGRGEVRNGTSAILAEDQRFDLVCAFEVLEHIEDDKAALLDWRSRLRDGGSLLLSVPAGQHRFGPADELVGHFRRYDTAHLTELLTDCGFAEVTVRHYGFPLGYLLEYGRNQIAARRLHDRPAGTVEERTATSGRLLQPTGALRGVATRWGTAPFRAVQRAFPGTGTGLIARARLA